MEEGCSKKHHHHHHMACYLTAEREPQIGEEDLLFTLYDEDGNKSDDDALSLFTYIRELFIQQKLFAALQIEKR